MDKLVSELYLIKQYEKQFAVKLRPIMHDLGAFRAEDGVDVRDSEWDPKKHKWVLNTNSSSKRRNEVVFFSTSVRSYHVRNCIRQSCRHRRRQY